MSKYDVVKLIASKWKDTPKLHPSVEAIRAKWNIPKVAEPVLILHTRHTMPKEIIRDKLILLRQSPISIPKTEPTNLSNVPGFIDNADLLNLHLVSINGHNIFLMGLGNRTFVLAKVKDKIIPFYISSHGTSGKIKGAWYPFFGNNGSWVVKGGVNPDGSMSYTKSIDDITKLLNDNLHISSEVPIHNLNIEGLNPYTLADRFSLKALGINPTEAANLRLDSGLSLDSKFLEELTGIKSQHVLNPDPGLIIEYPYISANEHISNFISGLKFGGTIKMI